MLLDHARELSKNPENEFVLILGHGPSEPQDNELELKVIAKHAERVKAEGGFADVKAYNFQDDAPPGSPWRKREYHAGLDRGGPMRPAVT